MYNFFNNSINWNWNLNWDNNLFFNLNNFAYLVSDCNDFVNINFFWHFNSVLNNLIVCLFDNFNCGNNFLNRDDFFYNFFYNIFFSDVGVNWHFNNLHSFFKHWDLNYFFNFNNLSALNDSVYNLLDDLWNLDNFFNHSRDNNNLLDDLLDFDHFWYFNHLFDDFVNIDSNLFNSFNGFWNLNYFLNCNFDWIINDDFDNLNSFYFNNFWNLDYFFDIFFDFDNNWVFNSFNHNLSDNLRYSYNFLFYYRNLHSSIDYFLNFANNFYSVGNDFFNFFYSFFIDNFFLNNFDFLDCWNFNSNLNDLLNNLWNLNDSFNSLD